MDTKQLFDALNSAGVTPHEDNMKAAEEVWIDALMTSERDFLETFYDYLEEMDERDYHRVTLGLLEASRALHTLGSRTNLGSQGDWAALFSYNATRAANHILENHRNQVTKFVEQYSLGWIQDCAGYQRDMDKYEGEG